MSRPIVIAYHVVWTAYGWWLPNDPRGGMSRFAASDVIADLGRLHYGRKKVQPASCVIRSFYERAGSVLKFPLRSFDGDDVRIIAEAFSQTLAHHRYTCYACAIMPEHVHLLIRRHRHRAEEMIANLQGDSRLRLREVSSRRWGTHPVWGGPGWKVFLDHPDEVRRTIHYIESNPEKSKASRQKWDFVKEYDDWPLHPGHSSNSPYVKRMRGRMQ